MTYTFLNKAGMFTKKKVLETYNQLYDQLFRKLDDEAEEKTGQRYTEVHKWRIIYDVLMLPHIFQEDRVLEIGPSMTAVIIKQLTGCTVETLCIDDLNKNFLDPFTIPLHLCDISQEKPSLRPESYDLILFCEVLEHFTLSPEHAVTTILSLVKPGKHIFFSVPNFASIQKRIQLLRGSNPQDPLNDKFPYFAHIREPVYEEAKLWWEQAGGAVVKEGFTNYDESQPGGFFSKLFWTARFIKIFNWYGLVHVWFPKTRRFFYFLITKFK